MLNQPEKLRQFDLKTPVLFYSGAASETDREAARVSGAQGYLVKPANGDQLIAEVTRLIAESQTTSPVEICVTAGDGGRRHKAKVPAREKAEVLAAFAAHNNEVTAGYKEK
jgi:DNA-binding response OmpR family regulator